MKTKVKTLAMLGAGILLNPIQGALASMNSKADASAVIRELIATGEIRQDGNGELVVSPYTVQVLSQTNLVSEEDILNRLEQKLQVEPQLHKAFMGTVL